MDENMILDSVPAQSQSADFSAEQVEQVEGQSVGESSDKNKEGKRALERISFFILIALVFFLPLIFQVSFSLDFSKISFVSLLVSIMVILECIAALKRGTFSFPKDPILFPILALPCLFIIAGFFSGLPVNSFFGTVFEVGTGISITLAVLLLLLISRILRTKGQIFGIYVTFFASLSLVAVYQLIRVVGGPGILSFGIFTDSAANLIGKWNELGIFFGLGAILSLITFELLKLSKSFRIVAVMVMAVSLFFVGLVNFLYVDICVSLVALILCLYFYRSHGSKEKISKASLTVALVSIIFIIIYFWGGDLRARLPVNLNPYQLEVSPSLVQTLDVAGNTFKSKPAGPRLLFGSGPNSFQDEWFLYKPSSVNLSQFWDADFSYGFGLIPTFLVTTGILGILAWIMFLILFMWLGWKTTIRDFWKEFFTKQIPSVTGESESKAAGSTGMNIAARYLSLSSFVAAVYLMIFSVVYVPSDVIFVLTFIFSGIFLSSISEEGRLASTKIFYVKKKFSFGIVFLLVVAIIAGVSLLFVTGKKIVASIDANDAVIAANQKGDISAAQVYLKKAVALDEQASYYRSLAQLDLLQANKILSQSGLSAAALSSQFQPVWNDAIQNMAAAYNTDPKDYQNQLMLGNMYTSVLPLGYPNAYTQANTAYQAALVIDPTDPLIFLSLAQLEAADKNVPSALSYINKALQEKPNYTDAIYFLAQLQASQNDISGAIQSVTALSQLNPTDPTVFYQLGYLDYLEKKYAPAIQALEHAVSLENDYSNARYFLGLSYYKVGRVSDSIAQFDQVLKLNPSNTGVETILANLSAGNAPLPDETTSADQKAANQKLKNQPIQTHASTAR
jgi:tetratricopeptide (TPR) repeat protein